MPRHNSVLRSIIEYARSCFRKKIDPTIARPEKPEALSEAADISGNSAKASGQPLENGQPLFVVWDAIGD
ncbi:MAG: hypothetical protein ACD_39C01346G0003, partial [uncultured bacterium]